MYPPFCHPKPLQLWEKIFIPYYLFFSANKNIMGFKKKVYANLAFHEDFLLLMYEHFKTQTYGRVVAHKVESLEEMKISYLPLDIEDSNGLHLDDEEGVAKIMKDLGRKKKKNLGKPQRVGILSLRLILWRITMKRKREWKQMMRMM